MRSLQLERPLAVFDIEATGVSPRQDRIIDLAIVVMRPDGTTSNRNFRVNPQMPIPEQATRIHGIRDEDVRDCPTFDDVAREVRDVFGECDLGGYNLLRYDIPLLEEEFIRARVRFSVQGRRVVDAQRIFHIREPRDLEAALRYYCDEEHAGAHGAEADAEATLKVIQGQLRMYADLPRDIDSLDRLCNPREPDWTDRSGRLRWVEGKVTINFGKKRGTPLQSLIEEDPNFIRWMLRSDFPRDTLDIVRDATEGRYPDPPADLDG